MRISVNQIGYFSLTIILLLTACSAVNKTNLTGVSNTSSVRERVLLGGQWRFMKYASEQEADHLAYDVRPNVTDTRDDIPADAMPTEAVQVQVSRGVLKPWILPTANPFINDPKNRHQRPAGNPGGDFAFVQSTFDDTSWEAVSIPHDWAIAGPFYAGEDAPVGGGMARLPSPGVAWYRKPLHIPVSDTGKALYLDVDGAMSYAAVWLNGHLVGGWPYGYASWRLDLTPYVRPGEANLLAIRIDNPPNSSRWYPGGGLFRNVWLTKTQEVHVAHWGTFVTTPEVSTQEAQVNLSITVRNRLQQPATVSVNTHFYPVNGDNKPAKLAVVSAPPQEIYLSAEGVVKTAAVVTIANPKLWGPPPTQQPNRYLAVTTLHKNGTLVDRYETYFGIRKLAFDPNKGVFVNGEHIYLKGVNQHHDLGALGAAFNVRAAERQLEMLHELGANAIRLAHNPPAPELLALADRMGFLVVNEIFDSWERKKTPLDFHLIFKDWSEPDLRAFIRRDRNHPSIIMWSLGNEVGEQYTGEAGVAVAQRLHQIAKEEDPTRPTAASMNYAKPDMPLSSVMDTISLNYQGEGIRNAPAYGHLTGIRTAPLYPEFHSTFPGKVILSSENAAAVSSRGEYFFPVTAGSSAPVEDGLGGNPKTAHVSAYELYTAPFGSSADKVMGSLAKHPYVAGGFVWSGWDYLGEPTPYYSARSSYFGVIDLAGFKKDRFYLYQSRWRPDLPMAHILPHWNWPQRKGKVTPVHVFTSGDEAELFLNERSLGRKKKATHEYRLRWDDVVYAPGKLRVQTYKNGEPWAESVTRTTGKVSALALIPDRGTIQPDAKDLVFVTVNLVDKHNQIVPTADNALVFSIKGPGDIVATDNGDPTSMVSFLSPERKAFNGKCLAILRAKPHQKGEIMLMVEAEGVEKASTVIRIERNQ